MLQTRHFIRLVVQKIKLSHISLFKRAALLVLCVLMLGTLVLVGVLSGRVHSSDAQQRTGRQHTSDHRSQARGQADGIELVVQPKIPLKPTMTPTPSPTPTSTPEPTPEPTSEPTATPTPEPTLIPTKVPTPVPTKVPTPVPTTPPTPVQGGSNSVTAIIEQVFGQYAPQAISVARCESGLNPAASNPTSIGGSHAAGLFQILYPSTWARTPQGQAGLSPYDATANTQAAYSIFSRDGYSWREWTCR